MLTIKHNFKHHNNKMNLKHFKEIHQLTQHNKRKTIKTYNETHQTNINI